MRSATQMLVRAFYEQSISNMTLEVTGWGEEGADCESVKIGPHPGFSNDCLVLTFSSQCNQHGFVPRDAPEVRLIIEALQGWLDWVDSGCVRISGMP